jgi:hypothetical protein
LRETLQERLGEFFKTFFLALHNSERKGMSGKKKESKKNKIIAQHIKDGAWNARSSQGCIHTELAHGHAQVSYEHN